MTGHRLDIDRLASLSLLAWRLPSRAPKTAARCSGTRQTTRAAPVLMSLLLVFGLDAGARSHLPGGAAEPVRLAEDAGNGMGEEDVRDVMHVMADSLDRLGDLIALEGVGTPDEIARRRRAIDAELEVLEELGSLLDDEVSGRRGQGSPLTDHVLIDEHVAEFVRRVARARRFAVENPPEHGPAARVGESCRSCHRRRDGSR